MASACSFIATGCFGTWHHPFADAPTWLRRPPLDHRRCRQQPARLSLRSHWKQDASATLGSAQEKGTVADRRFVSSWRFPAFDRGAAADLPRCAERQPPGLALFKPPGPWRSAALQQQHVHGRRLSEGPEHKIFSRRHETQSLASRGASGSAQSGRRVGGGKARDRARSASSTPTGSQRADDQRSDTDIERERQYIRINYKNEQAEYMELMRAARDSCAFATVFLVHFSGQLI